KRNREFQFSISSLFQLTTTIAVALAIITAIISDINFQPRDTSIIELFVLAAGLPTSLVAWAVLCDCNPQRPLILALSVSSAIPALIPLVPSVPGISARFFCLFFGQVLALAAALYICRIAGYRFARKLSAASDPE